MKPKAYCFRCGKTAGALASHWKDESKRPRYCGACARKLRRRDKDKQQLQLFSGDAVLVRGVSVFR